MSEPRKPSELLLEVINEIREERCEKWKENYPSLIPPVRLQRIVDLKQVSSEELMPIMLAYLDAQYENHRELISTLKDHIPNERDQFWKVLVDVQLSNIRSRL